jgi:hypothetical protein
MSMEDYNFQKAREAWGDGDKKKETFSWSEKEYVCPVHGDIRSQILQSTMPQIRVNLCLVCYMEKLIELGVCEVKEKNT